MSQKSPIATVPCAFAVVPFANFRYKLHFPQNCCRPTPFKSEIQGLLMFCSKFPKGRFRRFCYPPGLEFHLWKGKSLCILQRAFPLENLKVNGKHLKGHQCQELWQCRLWPLLPTCYFRPVCKFPNSGLRRFCYHLTSPMLHSKKGSISQYRMPLWWTF